MKQGEKNVLHNGIFPPFVNHPYTVNHLELLSNSSLLSYMLKISSKILPDLAHFFFEFAKSRAKTSSLWLICILMLFFAYACVCVGTGWTSFPHFWLTSHSWPLTFLQPLCLPIFLRHDQLEPWWQDRHCHAFLLFNAKSKIMKRFHTSADTFMLLIFRLICVKQNRTYIILSLCNYELTSLEPQMTLTVPPTGWRRAVTRTGGTRF